MPQPILRYDMRLPDFGAATHAELYAAAIEQCAWAEKNGFGSVHLSEHHGSEDGYCPSPLVFAGAIAARTETLQIFISALIAPLHDPVQLAEDLLVLDHISRGRIFPVLSAGYREEEFRAVGKTLADRKDYMDAIGPFLEQAWQGETFSHGDRTITIRPKPYSQPRPPILMGGSSRAAARRAARHADFFIPTSAEVFEYYREELQALGKPDPGPMPMTAASVYFVARDPDAYWAQIAPHLQHETNMYARWAESAGMPTPYRHFETTEELRAAGAYRVLTPDQFIEAAREKSSAQTMAFHPLCGGISPDLAWQSLQLFADQVLPALKQHGLMAQPGSLTD
jgi:alkanesulfonate monooxygenase SsuD/methylene tetrahydromethanopterin reductase-like flavin-dependent oxidoreductase (luciferase family)